MNTDLPSSPLSVNDLPNPADFAAAAANSEAIYLSFAHNKPALIPCSLDESDDGQGNVDPDTDTPQLFLKVLSHHYGANIARVVQQELGLAPSPGKALSSKLVLRALDMVHVITQTLSGVDFVTQLEHSPLVQGRGFNRACQGENTPYASLTNEQQVQIEHQLRKRFTQAAAQGESPVASSTVQHWLRELLRRPSNDS